MRGLKQDRSATVVLAGHALVQNLQRGHYELAIEEPASLRVATAFAILAAEGNEKYLILPEVLFTNNPNADADDAAGGLEGLPLNRRHPLHVLVHLGVPGADGDIAVMGSAQDPCAATGNYVNG